MTLLLGRKTVDPEIARKLELGVGDDELVELIVRGKRVGYMTKEAWKAIVAGGAVDADDE